MTTMKQKHQELIEQVEALLAKAKEMEHLIESEEKTVLPSEELFGIVTEVGELRRIVLRSTKYLGE